MKKHRAYAVGAVLLAAAPLAAFSPDGPAAPPVTVGYHLEAPASITLAEPVAQESLRLTVRSDDPSRALLSVAPDRPGSASITLTVHTGYRFSPEFFVQGLSETGTTTYTATIEGKLIAQGRVTLAPSAILILGPFKQTTFQTTPRGTPSKLTVLSAMLDNSMNIVEEQPVAGISGLDIRIDNSKPEAGSTGLSTLSLAPGNSEVFTAFVPSAEGKTTLTPVPPPGFRHATQHASVDVSVETPWMALADEQTLGKDLQMPGVLCLGEPAGPDGVVVTITSSDPAKLLISTAADKHGSASVGIAVAPGASTAEYYIQSLSDSGLVAFEAAAPGYRNRVAHATLAPSGLIVAYAGYGAPDEASVRRRTGEHEDRRFFASVAESAKSPVLLIVWSAYLDDGLAADITVQPLRPGVSATVKLTSSDPQVATVETAATIQAGSDHVVSHFNPLKPGKTVISIDTPKGFSTPRNAISVPAFVRD